MPSRTWLPPTVNQEIFLEAAEGAKGLPPEPSSVQLRTSCCQEQPAPCVHWASTQLPRAISMAFSIPLMLLEVVVITPRSTSAATAPPGQPARKTYRPFP